MRITYLLLEKYKRLMLSNIQRFEYRPKQNMQLVIGSNGSGKSSVMEQLTPLPAHHSQFVKGGVKEVHAKHHASRYVVRSVYDGGTGTHSFVRDDVELNTGGTFAVQRELVEQAFGLTKEIHELLVGITPFTGLSTTKRREWLTRLAPVDLQYAFQAYNLTKTSHRDQQGVVKHLTKRMGLENHDLPDDATLSRYREQVKHLTDKLDRLFQARQAETSSPFRSDESMKQQLTDLTQKAAKLLRYTFPDTHPTIIDHSTFLLELDGYQTHRQRLTSRLERMTEEHHRLLDEAPSRDVELTETQIAELRQHHDGLRQKVKALQSRPSPDTKFPLVELPPDHRPKSLLAKISDQWVDLMQTFPDNADGRFNRKAGNERQAEHRQLEADCKLLDRTQSVEASKLARLRACDTVVCPSCEHGFKPGVNPSDVTQLERSLELRGTELQTKQQRLTELGQYLEEFNDYLSYVRAFQNLVVENTTFKPVWDYCIENRVMVESPKDYITAVLDWKEEMGHLIDVKQAEQDLEVAAHRLRYVDAIDRNALTQLDQTRKRLEAEIETTTTELRKVGKELKALEEYQLRRERYSNALSGLIEDMTRFENDTSVHRDSLYQHAVSEETRLTQMRLAQTQEELSKAQLREGVLKDIETQHTNAMSAQSEFQLLSKALGPTEGLIGRYLMGFMQMVVELVNSVIGEVWTYPMEVCPSPMEKDELTYKFPLDVNKGAVIAPDIQLGSSSQLDIVNFAFKLVVMKFLKLDDYPLYLDEFGSTFDEQHRQNLIPFVNRMLELGQVNQVFFISHFNSTHGAFNQAEICVLDPTNITVPKTYNQHVTIS